MPRALGVGDVHPAIFGLPAIQRRLGDPVLAGKIASLRTLFMLADNRDDLLFRKSLCLHQSVIKDPDSNLRWRKFSVAGLYSGAAAPSQSGARTLNAQTDSN